MSKKQRKIYKKMCGACNKFVTYYHGSKPKVCPFCGSPYWDKPKTEVKLFELQDKYLETRDNDILSEMYRILVRYSKSLIYKIISGKYKYDEDMLEEKAHDATNGIISYYLQKPFFRIDNSFAGYLIRKVKEVLFSTKNEEDHESLNTIIQDSNKKELLDTLELFGYKDVSSNHNQIEFEQEIENNVIDVAQEVFNIINIAIDEIRKQYSSLIALAVLIGVKIQIEQQKKSFQDDYYVWRGFKIKKLANLILLQIYKYLGGKGEI